MEKVLTKLKHWQIFILLSASFVAYFTEIQDQDIINTSLKIIGFTVFFGWNALLGVELLCCFKNNYDFKKYLFILNCLIIFILASLLIFSNGKIEFKHLSFLNILVGIYIIYAFTDTFLFIAKLINEYRPDRKKKFSEYFIYFLGLILWPVGIWFIQPKLNKLAEK